MNKSSMIGDQSIYPMNAGIPTNSNNESYEDKQIGHSRMSINSMIKPQAVHSNSMLSRAYSPEVASEYPLVIVRQESETEQHQVEEL